MRWCVAAGNSANLASVATSDGPGVGAAMSTIHWFNNEASCTLVYLPSYTTPHKRLVCRSLGVLDFKPHMIYGIMSYAPPFLFPANSL